MTILLYFQVKIETDETLMDEEMVQFKEEELEIEVLD